MTKIFTAAIIAAALVACNAPDADKAKTGDATQIEEAKGTPYNVDSSSTVTWTGTKPNGSHTGTFKLTGGELTVSDSKLVGGKITIDVASLTNNDLASDPENKAKLEGHLKSPDFFDVAQYPTASFEISNVVPYVADTTNKTEVLLKDATHTITGNLTLKNKTKSISFPAKVTVDANTAAASADFNIDRTEWDMNYKGPGNPQDWIISKTVNIKFNLTATKK